MGDDEAGKNLAVLQTLVSTCLAEKAVGLARREAVELRVAECLSGRRSRQEPLLVSQHILAVLGADMPSLHHLIDGIGCGALAEEFAQQSQAHGFFLDKERAGNTMK